MSLLILQLHNFVKNMGSELTENGTISMNNTVFYETVWLFVMFGSL